MPPQVDPLLKVLALPDDALETLSMGQRIIVLKAVPYNVVADSAYGKLMFRPGAFGEVVPEEVRLRMDHADPPTGLGRTFEDKADAPYIGFKVSKTSRGDDQLQLARDGVSRGASIGFYDANEGPTLENIDGHLVTVYGPNSAHISEVSTTWQPTFLDAGVAQMLSKTVTTVTETTVTETAPTGEKESTQLPPEGNEPPVVVQQDPPRAPIMQLGDSAELKEMKASMDKMLGGFDAWQEWMRKQITAPSMQPEAAVKPKLHDWAMVAFQLMRGGTVSQSALKELALDDVITSDNPGLVPNVLVGDLDDLIDETRPFINSLRELTPPSTGMSLIVPTIISRATPYSQSAEKAELTGGTAPKVGTITFPYTQVFGGADVAIQMLNRGDASFFDLLTQLMAEAYSLDAEAKAIDALLDPQGTISGGGTPDGPQDGGTLDPENPHFGQAWQNSISVYRRAPDTIWMDAAAVGAFIDAKSPLTNAPLYSQLAAAFTAGNGPGGVLSGMRPIYVPALDDSDVDVIIGPSRSYVYAEDPARTLQVDVPSKAGRDIALVGGFFFGPRVPSAFTTYTIQSS